jgi:nucleoside-diphosphate-sugar epimerase
MRVAVTGGTGFLGAHIVENLLEEGHDVVCLVRSTSDRSHLDALGVEQVPGSLEDPLSLGRLSKDADALVHSAGVVAASRAQGYHRANKTGTHNLLQAIGETPLKTITYVSSLAAKGPSPTLDPRPATDTPRPVSTYGESKLGGESALRAYAETTETPATIIRPPALYGPRDQRILGLLKAARRGLYAHFLPHDCHLSLLYGPDCARLVAKSVDAASPRDADVRLWEPGETTLHTSASIYSSLQEVLPGRRIRGVHIPAALLVGAAQIGGLLSLVSGPPRMLNPDKVRELRAKHWLADPQSLQGVDWAPTHGLTTGLRATHDWFQQEGWL